MGTAPAAPRANALTPTAAPAPSAPSPAAPAPSTPAGPGSAPGAGGARGARGARGAWEHYRGALTSADFLFAVLTALLTLASWLLFLAGGPPAVVAGLGIAGALAGGIPIAVGALRGLLAREMNVDELVTIAIGASIYVGEYWGAALVAFMMLFGKVLEDVTAARAEQALEGLGQLVPATAQVLDACAAWGTRGVRGVRGVRGARGGADGAGGGPAPRGRRPGAARRTGPRGRAGRLRPGGGRGGRDHRGVAPG